MTYEKVSFMGALSNLSEKVNKKLKYSLQTAIAKIDATVKIGFMVAEEITRLCISFSGGAFLMPHMLKINSCIFKCLLET